MDAARLGIEIGSMVFIGISSYFGMKTAVKVVETKVTALETAIATHVSAINQRITDVANRVK